MDGLRFGTTYGQPLPTLQYMQRPAMVGSTGEAVEAFQYMQSMASPVPQQPRFSPYCPPPVQQQPLNRSHAVHSNAVPPSPPVVSTRKRKAGPPTPATSRPAVSVTPELASYAGVDGRQQLTSPKVDTAAKDRRKKQKVMVEEEDEDEAAKRLRGRPRLDTKDQTAADRRRTQIRLAQRAYRNRKETTIASLEQKVQELRGSTEQIKNIFRDLYEFSALQGLLHREPAFAGRFESAMEQITSLATGVVEDGHEEEGVQPSANRQSPPIVERPLPASSPKIKQEAPAIHETCMPPFPVWDCPAAEEGVHTSDASHAQILEAVQSSQLSQSARDFTPTTMTTSHDDGRVVDYPRCPPADSSGLNALQSFDSVPDSLPLPIDYTYLETSFARRLIRSTAQRARLLLDNEHLRPVRFNEVFGFILRFETKPQIIARFDRLVACSAQESLFDWRQPFTHLGGSGTFYPLYDSTLIGDKQPRFKTGMSMGPHTPSVLDTLKADMLDSFRMNVPGYQGEFFDANDVEGYLRRCGIVLGASETIKLDLDKTTIPGLTSSSSDGSASSESPQTPSLQFPDNESLPFQQNSSNPSFPPNIANASQFSKFVSDGVFSMTGDLDLYLNEDWAKMSMTELHNLNGFSDQPIQMPYDVSMSDMLVDSPPVTRTAVLDVPTLINQLISRGVCLGRTTAFRPKEVDLAVRQALVQSH